MSNALTTWPRGRTSWFSGYPPRPVLTCCQGATGFLTWNCPPLSQVSSIMTTASKPGGKMFPVFTLQHDRGSRVPAPVRLRCPGSSPRCHPWQRYLLRGRSIPRGPAPQRHAPGTASVGPSPSSRVAERRSSGDEGPLRERRGRGSASPREITLCMEPNGLRIRSFPGNRPRERDYG